MPPFFSPSFIFASVDESPTNSSVATTTLAPPLPCTDDERQEILRALGTESDDDKGDARRRSLLFMAVQSWFERLEAGL